MTERSGQGFSFGVGGQPSRRNCKNKLCVPGKKISGHLLWCGLEIKECESSARLAQIKRKARDMNEDSECKTANAGLTERILISGLGSQLVTRLLNDLFRAAKLQTPDRHPPSETCRLAVHMDI